MRGPMRGWIMCMGVVCVGIALVLPAGCSIPEAAFHPPVCGDGVLELPEDCEDGNAEDGDGCDSNCQVTGCGNGIATAGELCDDGNADSGDGCDNNCTLTGCGNGVTTASEACDDGNLASWDGCDRDCVATALAYVKASNTGAGDFFGYSVALSADGSTLAVGAYLEDSASTGINGDQTNNAAPDSGAVYVFARRGATWVRQAYIKSSNPGASYAFGWSVALSSDGSTLAVGAYQEYSPGTGIAPGAVYVFRRSVTTWRQQASVKASNAYHNDFFGASVALSGDGSTLAVGAYGEDSLDPNNPFNDSAPDAGAVYVYERSGTTWSQQAYVKASNTGAGDVFGYSVTLSSDGSTLAVGAHGEDSRSTGIDGNQSDNSYPDAGAVYVYARSGALWSQQAYVKASKPDNADYFGYSVALSSDGSTLAVSAFGEDSGAVGIDGNQADNSASTSGAVYVFTRTGALWSQQAYVKASNTGVGDFFGSSVALSGDGSILAVGAYGEDSGAFGTNGDQADNSVSNAGAAYVFGRSGATWTQQTYVKAPNTDAIDQLGFAVAVSGDGSALALGANGEDGEATGIDGDSADNAASNSGAVYVYY